MILPVRAGCVEGDVCAVAQACGGLGVGRRRWGSGACFGLVGGVRSQRLRLTPKRFLMSEVPLERRERQGSTLLSGWWGG